MVFRSTLLCSLASSNRRKAMAARGGARLLAHVGFSRHSALPALRDAAARETVLASVAPVRTIAATLVSLVTGCLLIGVAVALLVESRLGLAPYDVFSAGLGQTLGLSLGQAGWLVAGALFSVATVLGHRPNLWSVGYVVGNGLAIDAVTGMIATPASLSARLAFLLVGIVVMAAGINAVVHAGVTGGPFELLMAAGSDRGVSPTVVRYGLDLTVLLLGIGIGGPLGVGTVIYAASMAPVLRFVRQALLDHRAGRQARVAVAGAAPSDFSDAVPADARRAMAAALRC